MGGRLGRRVLDWDGKKGGDGRDAPLLILARSISSLL